MKKLIYTSVAVLGLFLVTSSTSQAGGIHFSFGGGHHLDGHGYYGGHGGHGHSGYYQGYAPLYRYHSYPRWHDTSHYDYHPGGFVPHGNHYHYVPGHYDSHQTGHWHH